MTQLSVFIGLLLAASPSQATYSIVATDRETNYIGGAGASCVQNLDIGAALYRGVPGKGVLHTQAVVIDVDSEAVTTALSLVGTAGTPDEILAKMNELDSGTEITDFYELPGPEFGTYVVFIERAARHPPPSHPFYLETTPSRN